MALAGCDRARVRGRRKKIFRKIHTILGFLLLFPLIVWTITGVLLVHKSDFGLDKKNITSEWVMSQYGLSFDIEPQAWDAAGNAVIQWDGTVVVNGVVASEVDDKILDVAAVQQRYCIATKERVFLYGADGKFVEALEPGLSMPEGEVLALGISSGNRLVLKNADGNHQFSEDFFEFNRYEANKVRWGKSIEANDEQVASAKAAIIGEGMPLDRVILDVHSGNIFGLVGKILVDMFALGVLGLSVTGVAIYVRKKRRSKVVILSCEDCDAPGNCDD